MPNGKVRKRQQSRIADAKLPASWVEREVADCEFRDERLGRRFRSLLEQLSSSPGDSIPLGCQDWANTKAAYRFLDNDRVSEAQILAWHFEATRERCDAADDTALILHDTTEFSFKREDIQAVGQTRIGVAGADFDGGPRHYTACGILMHSSLAVTPEGLPLGLTAIRFWSREKFKGTNALKKRINPTRVPIEEKESIRGSTTCGNPPYCWGIRRDACILVIARATSMSCSARLTMRGRTFCCVLVSIN